MKLLFIGDIMCHDEQLMNSKYGDNYNFDKSFNDVKHVFYDYDYVIGNLETVLTDGPYNGFPKFSTPKSFCGSAIKSGINCFMLANNHICDRGVEGVKSTINYFESNDILYTGVGLDTKSLPIIINNIGIINYTNVMNIKCENVLYNNLSNISDIKDDINYLKKNGVKTIIAFVHWGNEYETKHSREQETIAKNLINIGVDIIIGSHPHVIQDVGYIYNHPIVYSMGNFITSQIEDECKKSIGVELDINNDNIYNIKIKKFEVIDDDVIKVKESI